MRFRPKVMMLVVHLTCGLYKRIKPRRKNTIQTPGDRTAVLRGSAPLRESYRPFHVRRSFFL